MKQSDVGIGENKMADEKEVVSMPDLQADTEELMVPVFPAGRYSVMVKFADEDPDKRFTPATLLVLWLTRPSKKGKGSIDETEYRD